MVIMVDVLPARTSVGSDVGGVGMTATDEAIQASCNAVTIDGKPQEEVDGKSPAVTGKKTTKTVEGETKKPVDGKMEMADTNAEASTGEKLDTEGKSATELSAMARDAVEKGGDWETVIDLHAKALQVMVWLMFTCCCIVSLSDVLVRLRIPVMNWRPNAHRTTLTTVMPFCSNAASAAKCSAL